MHTPPAVSRGLSFALLALVSVMLAPPLRPAATDASPKDHSIFVGTDVTVGLKGKYYHVIGMDKNALRIMLDHKETVVPLALAKDIRVKQGVKLSNLSASVANLHGAQGANHVLDADEISQMHDAMAAQSMLEFQRDKAVAQAGASATFVATPDPNARQEAAPAAADPLTVATTGIDSKISQLSQVSSDRLAGNFGPAGDLSAGGFDVTFEVSAPQPLEQCHLAVIASYTIPGDANLTLNKIELRPLGTLGSPARKIVVELRGFPAGAELKSYRVALYSNGLEVATNISARRTEVTRDEAVIFLTMDYLAKHPGETLPPAPVLMVPRVEFVSRLGSAPRDQTIYARVGKDGRILRLSTDAAGSAKLSADLNSAADQIAFVPALEKGKPVEGVAKFKLADLVASN